MAQAIKAGDLLLREIGPENIELLRQLLNRERVPPDRSQRHLGLERRAVLLTLLAHVLLLMLHLSTSRTPSWSPVQFSGTTSIIASIFSGVFWLR